MAPAPPAPRFAGTELVRASAALFDSSPWLLAPDPACRGQVVGAEGRTFRLTISAGTVGLALRDPARLERNRQNGLGHDPTMRDGYAVEWDVEHPVYGAVVRDSPLTPGYGVLEGFERARPDEAGGLDWHEPNPSRRVRGWSRRSRARMVRTLAQLDWSPMYPDSLGYGYALGYSDARPAVMVTLTYPASWEPLAPSGRALKRHLDLLRKRYLRAWGAAPVGPWKLEFQRRGAPHVHLMLVPPRGTAVCRCSACACWCLDCDDACGTYLRFADWLSHTWADVVGSSGARDRYGYPHALGYSYPGRNPRWTELQAHRAAGTGVDYLRGGRAFDPKRAAVYFSKHGGAAGGKEYQHDVPELWQAPGAGPGRFWGYWGLEKVTAAVDVDYVDYVRLRRTLRRWSVSQGLTRKVRVPRARVDVTTGEVRPRYRTVTRPLAYLAHGGLNGGTVLVNDGPGFASTLARGPAATRPTGAFLP